MKIFIDVAKKLILKTDTENRTLFKGEDAADVIKVYFEATPTNWYLTLGALLPNGRTISDRFHDGPIGAETINGTRYYYEEFTITKANGWNLCNGKVSFTLKLHETNAKGDNVATKVIGTFVATIVDAVVTNENILILDGDTSKIVANMQQQIESIRALVTEYRNAMTAVNLTVADTATIPNVSGIVRFEDGVDISGPAEMGDSVTIHGDAEFKSDNINCPNSIINNDSGTINTTLINAVEVDTDTLLVNGLDVESYSTATRNLIEAYKSEHTAQYNDLVNAITDIQNLLSVDKENYNELQEIVNAILSNEEGIKSLVNSLAKKVEKSDYESDKSTIYSTIAQNTLTAGNGIKIDKGVISIDIPNGDEVAY